MQIAKSPDLKKNPKAINLFLQEVDKFRRRRKRSPFMKLKPFIEYFTINKRKALFQFIDELEDFRCEALGMPEQPFYRIVAEFVLEPSQRHYYNPVHLFGATENWDADEFRSRIFHTLIGIAQYVDAPGDSISKLVQGITDLRIKVDVSGGRKGTKDWFCLKALLQHCLKKGWTLENIVERIHLYYRRRIKKVYPEMVLRDVFRGELDQILLNNKEDKKVKEPTSFSESIRSQEWYNEWIKGKDNGNLV
jgi:hypothetical protein